MIYNDIQSFQVNFLDVEYGKNGARYIEIVNGWLPS